MAGSKRQTTFAKIAREHALKEKRARKQEKKDERKAAALNPEGASPEEAVDEQVDD